MKRKLENEVINSNKKPRNAGNPDNFHAQNLPDTALQAIENTFRQREIQAFKDLTQLLKTPVNIIACEALLRNLTVYLKQNRNISRDMVFALTSLGTIAFHNLEHLLNEASNTGSGFVAWKKSLPPNNQGQKIAFLIYNCGQIAEKGLNVPRFSASNMEILLHSIQATSIQTSKSISNSLYGLGLLAEADKLGNRIKASLVQAIFNKLLSLPNLETQHISNSLYGLGLLAKMNKLQGNIEASSVQDMLYKLLSLTDLNTQDISISLYGIGFLAEACKLEGNIKASLAQAIFNKLLSLPNLKTQHISNSLYGLGLLAKMDTLQGNIEASSIQDMFKKLSSSPNLKTQEIGNCLHSLGWLAKTGKLHNNIKASPVQDMFNKLLSLPDLEARHISNSLYGIGLLAEMDKLEGNIEASSVQAMFNKLLSLPNVNAQCISNSLYGLGLLAKASKLEGNINASSVQGMLNKLWSLPNLNAQDISNSLYGIGLLAKASKLQGNIETSSVQGMLNKLWSLPNLKTQEISNSLYGLGLLAKTGKLEGNITASSIQDMLNKLWSLPDVTTQEINNGLYGIALLAETDKLRGTIQSGSLQSLLEKLMTLNPSARDAMHTLNGLSMLIPHLNPPPAANNLIKKLIRIALNGPYLHPTMAAVILNNLVILKDSKDDDSTDLFRETIDALGIRLERFPSSTQKQLQANIKNLATRPRWQSMLQKQLGLKPSRGDAMEPEIPEPVRITSSKPAQTSFITKNPTAATVMRASQPHGNSAHFTKACKDKIFQAIATKNAKELRVILKILKELSATASATTSTPGKYIPQRHPFVTQKPHNAEQLVIDFLYLTNATALRELISQSPAQYFILLLQACSAHTRFQLAQNNILHPIIINLSSTELPALINKLSSPFQIYRDHQALLHVIDALTVRAEKKPQEQKAIHALQTTLLTEALKFHMECKHTHVVQRLRLTQTRLEKNELMLLDMNDNDDDALPKPAFQPQKPAATPATGMVINNKYQYETEDIQAILTARMKPYTSVTVMAAAQMNQNIRGNSAADVLAPYISKLPNEGNQKSTLLVPIHLPGHWVGLMVAMQGDRISKLTYFNSSKNEAKDNQHMALIKNQLYERGLLNEALNVEPAERAMQQCDATSCGVLLIENFYCSFKGLWHGKTNNLTDNETKLIRQRHLEVLHAERPDYNKGFYNRQAQNAISVPDLVTQQRSHGITNNSNGFFKPVTKPQPAKITDHSRLVRNDGREVQRS